MALTESTKQQFFVSVDQHLNQSLPQSTNAFFFNLYEAADSIHVQLDGGGSFELDGASTLGNPTFSTGEDIFEIPRGHEEIDWLQWLQLLTELCKEYIRDGRKADVLRESRGVGIGFVDGDIDVLWVHSTL